MGNLDLDKIVCAKCRRFWGPRSWAVNRWISPCLGVENALFGDASGPGLREAFPDPITPLKPPISTPICRHPRSVQKISKISKIGIFDFLENLEAAEQGSLLKQKLTTNSILIAFNAFAFLRLFRSGAKMPKRNGISNRRFYRPFVATRDLTK